VDDALWSTPVGEPLGGKVDVVLLGVVVVHVFRDVHELEEESELLGCVS